MGVGFRDFISNLTEAKDLGFYDFQLVGAFVIVENKDRKRENKEREKREIESEDCLYIGRDESTIQVSVPNK